MIAKKTEHALALYRRGLSGYAAAKEAGIAYSTLHRRPEYKLMRDDARKGKK